MQLKYTLYLHYPVQFFWLMPCHKPFSASSFTSHKCTCVGAAGDVPQEKPKGFLGNQASALKSLLTPFSDPQVNARLISLCVASALCSVATLIHDTYLPIYLSEQLGLSNTKVSHSQQSGPKFGIHTPASFMYNLIKPVGWPLLLPYQTPVIKSLVGHQMVSFISFLLKKEHFISYMQEPSGFCIAHHKHASFWSQKRPLLSLKHCLKCTSLTHTVDFEFCDIPAGSSKQCNLKDQRLNFWRLWSADRKPSGYSTVSMQCQQERIWDSCWHPVPQSHGHFWDLAYHTQQANVCSLWLGLCQLWNSSNSLLDHSRSPLLSESRSPFCLNPSS